MKSTDETKSHFDRIAVKLADAIPAQPGNKKRGHHLEQFLPASCGAVLDIGCGMGGFCRRLAARSRHVLGLDLSPEMIRVAREQSRDFPNVEFQAADVMKWDFPAERFDAIVSVAAFHLLPLEPILVKIRGSLRPGGVLAVHDLYTTESWLYRLAEGWRNLRRSIRKLVKPHEPVRERIWRENTHNIHPTIQEVRAAFNAALPGVKITERVTFRRYTAVWKKPDS